jgi:hypothetical protein
MTDTQTNRNILAQKTSAPNLSNSEITLFCDGRNMYPPVIKRGNGKSSANEGSMGTSPINTYNIYKMMDIPLQCLVTGGLKTTTKNNPLP